MEQRHLPPTRTLAFLVLAGLALAGCVAESPVETSDGLEMVGPQMAKARSAGATYVLSAGKWNARQARAVRRAGGTVVWSHRGAGIGVVTSSDPDFLEDAMATRAFRTGARDRVVEWQQPIPTAKLEEESATPGDEPFFPLQWNLQSMEVPAAWAESADGSGARVAVIDGGIRDTHEDLAGQVDVGCSTSFVDGVPFNEDTDPLFWHGTHVAGIIAAADNDVGVIGIAPQAEIMAVKALHEGAGSFAAVIGAILFASDPGAFPGFESCARADIINMSLGAAFFKHELPGLIGPISRAVNYAASNGVLVISAAGNNGLDFGQLRDATVIPAQAGSGLAIAATGPVDFANGGTNFRRIASYSNWGEDLTYLAAPGGDFTLFPDGLWFFDMVLSLCGGDDGMSYCFAAGTSMAAPAASGVAALIVGENPGISLGKLKRTLKNSADDEGKRGKDEFYGHGFVNAFNAVTR